MGFKKIVCATNKNLRVEVTAGKFREDLFHRVSGLTIHLEPLGQRPEDLRLLVKHFLETDPELKPRGPFSESEVCDWVGKYEIIKHYQHQHKGKARAVVEGGRVRTGIPYDLPPEGNIRELREHVRQAVLEGTLQPRRRNYPVQDPYGSLVHTKAQIEPHDWEIAFSVCRFQNRAGRLKGKDAAKILGISESTLSKKRRRLGL
jgi:transcriptional regulator with GAF, ATPase, and Fis domain